MACCCSRLREIEEVRPDRLVLENFLAGQSHELVRKYQPLLGVENVIVRNQRAAIAGRFIVHGGNAKFCRPVSPAALLELGDDRFDAATRVEYIIDKQK